MAEGEVEADADGPLALLHQFARDVVYGCDVIRIHRVTQAETVGQQRCPQKHRLVVEHI